MKPRDYQIACRRAIFEAFKTHDLVLIVLPTGMGKTVIFSDVIRSMFPRRAMVIAHRKELIYQARDKIKAVTGFNVEVEMGDVKSSALGNDMFSSTQAIVSSIQTLTAGGDGAGRIGKFDPDHFGILVIDEAHHSPSLTYKRAIDYFRSNARLKVLGVTATPDRADEEALGQIFQTVAFDYETLDAIKDGWLVPIFQQMVSVGGLDFSEVRTTAGDLNGADLASVMENEKVLHGIAHPSLEIIGSKSTLVFASSVNHARTLSEIYNRHRPGSSNWICGKTDPNERDIINKDFISGKLQILCNCGTHLEGFDSARIEVIIQARPTKSRALYAQMIGRGTRPLPGLIEDVTDPVRRRWMIAKSAKPSCLVVDFVGNSGRHKLMNSGDILGGKVSDKILERVSARIKKAGNAPVRTDQLIDEEEENLKQEEIKKRQLEELARKSRLVLKAQFSTQQVDPFDVLQLRPVVERGWDKGRKLSEKQANFLRKQGIKPDAMPYSQATQLIREMMGRFDAKLCTYKQAKFLKNKGYDTNVSFEEASKLITAIIHGGARPDAKAAAPKLQDREIYQSPDSSYEKDDALDHFASLVKTNSAPDDDTIPF